MSYALKKLVALYLSSPDASLGKLSYRARVERERLLTRIAREHGDIRLEHIRRRTLFLWYDAWVTDTKVAMGYKLMGELRGLFRFGFLILEDPHCLRLLQILKEMRFQTPAAREVRMNVEQATAIRAKAHEYGYGSIALAQALQFEFMLSQKDVIGEWVPSQELKQSDVRWRDRKWLRGLRWSSIEDEMALRHRTGKRQKLVEFDLTSAPMVQEELRLWPDYLREKTDPS
jgi:hypothetical protein